MHEIVERLHENRQIELAKSILEEAGYTVSEGINDDTEDEIDDNECLEESEEGEDIEESCEESTPKKRSKRLESIKITR